MDTAIIIKLEFTEQEIQALVSLLDSGLKSQGLNSAVAAAVIYQKIQAACRIPKEVKP